MTIPSEILVHFAQGEAPIRCGSLAEMDSVLDRLHAERKEQVNSGVKECPLQVMISFLGHEINLGLGSEDSFVMIGTDPFDDWYYAASGKEADGEDKEFYGFNQDTYWPANWLVPINVAREAVHYFVCHQQRSPLVGWDY
jgi:hypothetical protein